MTNGTMHISRGSVRWFENKYGNGFQCTPIMIHKTNAVDTLAIPPQGTRIVTPELLDKLKKQIRDFATALAQSGNWQDETRVSSLLLTYKLRGQDIAQEYSATFTIAQG